jgi:hypothetical protein
LGQPVFGIAEVVEFDAHAIHDPEIQTANLAVVVSRMEVIERSAGFEGAAEAADGTHSGVPLQF